MNAITTTITAAPPAELATWIDKGRMLASQRRNVDWQIADWMQDGQAQGFIDQAGFDFLADNLGIAPKRLKDISRAAAAFPVHLRDAALSIEHHASVAALPSQDAMQLLHTARDKHWTAEQTRFEAQRMKPREDNGPRIMLRDEDAMLESFIHHWNRLTTSVRLAAAERISESHGGEIEP